MISRRFLYFIIATTVTAVITAYAVDSPRWHAKDNALYIAQQLSPLRSEESLDALNSSMEFNVNLLATSLEKQGWTIVDLDALTEAVKQEARIIETLEAHQQARYKAYYELLSPRQLEELAQFYKTAPGQWMAIVSRTIVAENGVTRNITPEDTNGLPPEFAPQIRQFRDSDLGRDLDNAQAEFAARHRSYSDELLSEEAKEEMEAQIFRLMLREDLMYHSDPAAREAIAKIIVDYDQRKADKAQAAE